ncbi:RNA polymerase sigma factor [Dyadobacter beijingensis]|nr:sigma-70 family RNA polymerase sigma factor [Dyadobacter beijingensis]
MQSSPDIDDRESNDADSDLESDAALWQGFYQGDADSFEALATHFYPVLLRYGVRLVRDKDFAHDCLQDFFIDLWGRRARLENIRSVRTYLLLSYRRRLFREMQSNGWYKFASELDENLEFDGQFSIEIQLIESETKDENLKKLHHHLSLLTKRQREAIYLRFNQELNYDEIAAIMSINHQSAVNLVYEALKFLRKAWFQALLVSFFTLL